MKKTLLFTLALILLFSASAFADAVCGMNAPKDGLEDCGVDYDPGNDGTFELHFSSLKEFLKQANGFPSTITEGMTFAVILHIRNNNGFTPQNVSFNCVFWQNVKLANDVPAGTDQLSIRNTNPPFLTAQKLTLPPGTTGSIERTFEWSPNIVVLEAAAGQNPVQTSDITVSCEAINSAGSVFSSGGTRGYKTLTMPATASKKIQITDISPWNYDLDSRLVGGTVELDYVINNTGTDTLAITSTSTQIVHGRPLIDQSYGENGCTLTGSNTIPAGESRAMHCTHAISFLEGDSRLFGVAVFGSFGQVELRKAYTALGGSYNFTSLEALSLYNNAAGELEATYKIAKEAGTSGSINLVAQVKESTDTTDKYKEIGRWSESGAGTYTHSFAGYGLEAGKKNLRLMAFNGTIPGTLPNPTNSFVPNLYHWIATSYSVPRAVQPNNKAYFPGGNTFSLAPGQFKLGIRNLSDVSGGAVPVQYRLSLANGNPANITSISIVCNEPGGCPAQTTYSSWQSLAFNFSKVRPSQDFDDDSAPGLNAQITMNIQQPGTYEFKLEALNNPPVTTFNEMNIDESLVAALNKAPTADAGGDNSSQSGAAVSLSGACADSDGTITNCNWTAPAGCSLGTQTKSGLNTANATSTVNATCTGTTGTKFILTLTATDNSTAMAADTMLITLANTPPTANAGLDQSTPTGVPVSLVGNCSDSAGGTISDCKWADAPAGCTFQGSRTESGSGTANASSSVSAICSGAPGNSFTFALTATDNDEDSDSDEMLVIIQAPDNEYPIAKAGGPYAITLSFNSISLDGSGTIDAEQCPSGGTSCSGLSYSWTITANSANCSPTTRTGVRPAALACTSIGSADVRLTVTDSGIPARSDSDDTTITVSPPAGSGPYLRLTKIDVEPENFNAGTLLDFTKLDVTVKNFGDPTDASIGIKVFGATDFSMADSLVPGLPLASCGLFGKDDAPCTKSLEAIDISSLAPGSYKLVVKAYGDGTEYDSDSVFFVVIGTVPVPELGAVFAPLLAISALAIMFFAGKKRKG